MNAVAAMWRYRPVRWNVRGLNVTGARDMSRAPVSVVYLRVQPSPEDRITLWHYQLCFGTLYQPCLGVIIEPWEIYTQMGALRYRTRMRYWAW